MSVSCVPIHLQYVLTELMKNACRATVERHGHLGLDDELPPVQCHVVVNSAEIIINIKDHGGGIPRGKMADVWKFLYSTSKVRPWDAKRFDCRQKSKTGVLAGYGVGLGLSQLYVRYLGGNLVLE